MAEKTDKNKARIIPDRVKKQLYALSGNECANPSCHNKLVYPDDDAKDDQICHIEAASANGPRFNPNQTDDERRSFDNLILLCHKCHDMIDNNPDAYTVELLKKWKRDHEAKYKDNYKPKTFSFSVPQGLLPRDKEVDTLYDGIINNRFFNLVGVGGSGKSSLAALMKQKHENNFNEIVYVTVNNNIKDDVVSKINGILNVVEKDADNKYETVISYLDVNFKSENPNLLILDINKTEKNEDDKIAAKELKTTLDNWDVLIISREPFKGFKSLNLNQNEDIVFLKELFLERAGREKYENFGQFDELFKTICHSPILAEQLGLYLNKLPTQSLDDIKAIFLDANFREEELENRNDTLITFLKKLIDYNSFKGNEKDLLRHFVLWQSEYIGYNVIKNLMNGVFASDGDFKNAIVSLSQRAILTTDGKESYKLHGLLAESLRGQINIAEQDYSVYLWNIQEIIEYDYYDFIQYADCIGNSMSKYDIVSEFLYGLLNNVGSKMKKSWKTDYAKRLYEKYILIVSNKVATHPNNTDYKNDLAKGYINFAILYDDKSAEAKYLKSIEISQQLPKDNYDYLDTMALAYNNLANLQSNHLKDYKSSEKNYKNAIIVREKMPKDNPDYQNNLATIYYNLALLQKNDLNDYKSAGINYKNAIEIKEKLPKDDPKYQYWLAAAYGNLANLQIKHLNDYKSAEINYKKEIETKERFANNPEYQDGLALAYYNLAILQRDYLKDYKSAEDNFKKAIEIEEPLLAVNWQIFLIRWVRWNVGLAELYYYCVNKTDTAKDILEEIMPLAEEYLVEKPNDKETIDVNRWIRNLLAEINTNNNDVLQIVFA